MELTNDWHYLLKNEFTKQYFLDLKAQLDSEKDIFEIFPSEEDIFKALNLTAYTDVKIVIIGQDPYHNINQADGLAFSVSNQTKRPPSLQNIFTELESDLGIIKTTNDLTDWAKQGVLLLNTVLTVRKNQPASHKSIGWEIFTQRIIELLNNKTEPIFFILWGNFAISKRALITNSIHYIHTSPHPSPLSAYRGFFGSKPFSKANQFLKSHYNQIIQW